MRELGDGRGLVRGLLAMVPGLALVLACAGAVPARADAGAADDAAGPLHVPSPDWRDQVIYFVMIDRFDNGDPSNDDQGTGEFDPASGARFSGGDLAGVERRLEYIRGLGATAVWVTPPVANRWWDPAGPYGGYHGYWAEDFSRVDLHFGTLADYQRLSRRLHAAGMYLVQDIVVNHTANFYMYGPERAAADPARGFRPNPGPGGRSAPTQAPFDRNDARDPQQQREAIYHWTPVIADFGVQEQQWNWQLADLDDLNTENPVVRAALRQSYGHWIREAGVDAFRVDTAFYVPPAFFEDFLEADDAAAPGILRVARATGRADFHAFGEGFALDRPYDDAASQRIEEYMRGPGGARRLPGMINFPLYGALVDVFARGHPSAELGYRIRRMMQLHERPQLMPTFVDNHDVDRFLAGGSHAGLQQALLAIMTLPGIPTIYYGTEQGYTGQRDAMFRGGYGAGGNDHFDTQAPLYRYLHDATALRRAHPQLSRGTPTVLRDNAAGPGALAWRMTAGEATALVVLNTADQEALLDNLDTGLAAGTVLRGVFGIGAMPEDLVVGAGGRINRPLAARGGWVWIPGSERAQVPPVRASITLDPLPAAPLQSDFPVSGSASGMARLKLVVDGDLAAARAVAVDDYGRWSGRVHTASMIDAGVEHSVVAWSGKHGLASPAGRFRVQPAWRELVDVSDPAGDDSGPNGRYRYPTDPTWGQGGQLDILGLTASAAGGALQLELRMRELTAAWNPSNGFDHVAFTVFLQLPGNTGGARVMPQQNAQLPQGMRWNYRLRAHGWSNALFSAAGAALAAEGSAATPGARIEVDRARGLVRFVLPAAALGNIGSLAGAKLYVTTWDYDGGYRALGPTQQPNAFGGGNPGDALVMDDTAVIVLP